MARVIFQRADSGYRLVRGQEVRRIQMALRDAGHSPGEVDGIYGGDTTNALTSYQKEKRFAPTGKLTDETYTALTGESIPSLQGRSLQLTGDFEGHGFERVAGNFDGAGLTWGIIGFTLKHGEIQAILNEVLTNHQTLFDQTFGPNKDKLRAVLADDRQAQLDWADSISLGANKDRIEETWANAFETLGLDSAVQDIQLKRAAHYWTRGVDDAARFALKSELGAALCFDIAVQNGGIDTGTEERRIRRWIQENPGTNERELRIAIADIVAENSNPRWVEDVRKRKRTLATGEGSVHGLLYAIRNWGLDDVPAG